MRSGESKEVVGDGTSICSTPSSKDHDNLSIDNPSPNVMGSCESWTDINLGAETDREHQKSSK